MFYLRLWPLHFLWIGSWLESLIRFHFDFLAEVLFWSLPLWSLLLTSFRSSGVCVSDTFIGRVRISWTSIFAHFSIGTCIFLLIIFNTSLYVKGNKSVFLLQIFFPLYDFSLSSQWCLWSPWPRVGLSCPVSLFFSGFQLENHSGKVFLSPKFCTAHELISNYASITLHASYFILNI